MISYGVNVLVKIETMMLEKAFHHEEHEDHEERIELEWPIFQVGAVKTNRVIKLRVLRGEKGLKRAEVTNKTSFFL
jgi:hypothetical protein